MGAGRPLSVYALVNAALMSIADGFAASFIAFTARVRSSPVLPATFAIFVALVSAPAFFNAIKPSSWSVLTLGKTVGIDNPAFL